MKVRTDFVTNSSSSSFIFGEPKVVSGLTVTGLIDKISKRADSIIEVIEYITKELNTTDKRCLMMVEAARFHYINYITKFYKTNSEEIRTQLYNICENLKYKICDRQSYKNAVNNAYNKYSGILQEYWNNIRNFEISLEDFYILGCGFKELHTIKSYVGGFIVDFKQSHLSAYDYDLIELLQWYEFDKGRTFDVDSEEYKIHIMEDGNYMICDECSEDGSKCSSEKFKECYDKMLEKQRKLKEETNIDYYKAIFNCLGEYGIYGLWEGDIPYIIVMILQKEARLSCNHMG